MSRDQQQKPREILASSLFADAAADSVANWVDRIQSAIEKGNTSITNVAGSYSALSPDKLRGFYAEAFHEATFNVDAAVRNSSEQVLRIGSTENASPDLRTSWGDEYSSKYYASAPKSFLQQARTEANDPLTDPSRYEGMERLIPSDQLEEAKTFAKGITAQPEKALRFQEAQDRLTDTVRSPEGGTSRPLSKDDADMWAKDAKSGHVRELTYGESVSLTAHLKEIGEAAGVAAVLNVAIQSAPVIINGLIRLLRDPKYRACTFATELKEWGSNRVVPIAADTFIKSALAASFSAANKAGTLPPALSGQSPEVYAGVAVAGIEAAKQLWLYSRGQCTAEQAASESFKSGLRTSAALTGKVVGQTIIPIPVLGGIIGSFIASYFMNKGIDSVENSQTVVLLRVLDQHFKLHKDSLQAIFSVSVDYHSISRAYDTAIANYSIIIAHKAEHHDNSTQSANALYLLSSREQESTKQLEKRNQLLEEIGEGTT